MGQRASVVTGKSAAYDGRHKCSLTSFLFTQLRRELALYKVMVSSLL